jgi:hypothetical protein
MGAIMQRLTQLLVWGKFSFHCSTTIKPNKNLLIADFRRTLTGIPIAGEILSRANGDAWGLIIFTTCCYAGGLICAISVKVMQCGWCNIWSFY